MQRGESVAAKPLMNHQRDAVGENFISHFRRQYSKEGKFYVHGRVQSYD